MRPFFDRCPYDAGKHRGGPRILLDAFLGNRQPSCLLELSVNHAQLDGIEGIVGASHKHCASERHVMSYRSDAATASGCGKGDRHKHHLVPVGMVGLPLRIGFHTLLMLTPKVGNQRREVVEGIGVALVLRVSTGRRGVVVARIIRCDVVGHTSAFEEIVEAVLLH